MRVNARLDAEARKQLEYLLEATGLGVSDVLKASLAHYHAAVYAARAPRLKHLSAHIGRTGSGRRDVAVRSKELLTDSLAAKTGPGPVARPDPDARPGAVVGRGPASAARGRSAQ